MFAAQYKFDKPNRWINSAVGAPWVWSASGQGHQDELPGRHGCILDLVKVLSDEHQETSTLSAIWHRGENLLSEQRLPRHGTSVAGRMNYEGRHSSSYMDSLPDWIKLVETYGHVGINVKDKSELKGALDDSSVNTKHRLVFVNGIDLKNTYIRWCPQVLCAICG